MNCSKFTKYDVAGLVLDLSPKTQGQAAEEKRRLTEILSRDEALPAVPGDHKPEHDAAKHPGEAEVAVEAGHPTRGRRSTGLEDDRQVEDGGDESSEGEAGGQGQQAEGVALQAGEVNERWALLLSQFLLLLLAFDFPGLILEMEDCSSLRMIQGGRPVEHP